MARSRTIKPGFFLNELLGECDPLARLLFAGLWTVADREGRLPERPRRLKAELLPYDDVDIDGLLRQLAERGFIVRYAGANSEPLIQIATWNRHQRPHQSELQSTLPAPPDEPPVPESDRAGALPREEVDRPGALPREDGRGTPPTTKPDPEVHVAPSGNPVTISGSPEPDSGLPGPDSRRPRAVAPANGADGKPAAHPPKTKRPGGCPKPSKVRGVVDAVRAASGEIELSDRDIEAIEGSGAPPEELAAAFVARYRGEWGDDFDRARLCMHDVVNHINGYRAMLAARASPAPPIDVPSPPLQPATAEDQAAWTGALERLAASVTRTNFDTWLAPTTLLGRDGPRLVIAAPNETVRDWLQTRLRVVVQRALQDVGAPLEDVAFAVAPPTPTDRAPPAAAEAPVAIAQ